jgi:hypothetical protein
MTFQERESLMYRGINHRGFGYSGSSDPVSATVKKGGHSAECQQEVFSWN